MGQRTVFVLIERLVELGERAGEVALLLQRQAAKNGGAQLHVGRIGEHVMVGIDGDAPRPPEGFHGERRVGAHHLEFLVFGFAVGVDAQVDGHAEQVEVLGNLSGHAEAFIVAQAIGGVLQFEFRRAGGIEPLREEPGELLAVIFLGDGAEVVHGGRISRRRFRRTRAWS